LDCKYKPVTECKNHVKELKIICSCKELLTPQSGRKELNLKNELPLEKKTEIILDISKRQLMLIGVWNYSFPLIGSINFAYFISIFSTQKGQTKKQ
jgi:hypothetical protein